MAKKKSEVRKAKTAARKTAKKSPRAKKKRAAARTKSAKRAQPRKEASKPKRRTPARPVAPGPGSATPSTVSGAPRLRVRMYRQGLGDCFLLTFDVGGDERHMLIDCGTLGNKTTKPKMKDVADHILATLDGGKLDVVVVTHEHKDHVSGFIGKNGPMKRLAGRVDHVWLAWTEDPDDPDAQRIAKYEQDLGTALAALVAATPDSSAIAHIADLLGFAGDESPLLGAGKFAKTVDEAMEFVRTGLGAKTAYYEPGDVIEESWLPGFRFYVLGPPRVEASLRDVGSHDSEDLYHVSAGQRAVAAMLRAAALPEGAWPNDPEQLAAFEATLPFDRRFNGRGEDLLQTQYPSYYRPAEEWRTIDDDWVGVATDLALQLDNLTNNTSLALAIERVADGKVLLFPADAQQGNWLSWHAPNRSWTVGENDSRREVQASELLANVVFYKVGHHASHNATASRQGLELMRHEDELVAFIPVDRTIALGRNPKGTWRMPARSLYRRLLEKCQGRVVRSDLGWADDAARHPSAAQRTTEKELRNLFSNDQWDAFRNSQQAATTVRIEDFYVEYTLS